MGYVEIKLIDRFPCEKSCLWQACSWFYQAITLLLAESIGSKVKVPAAGKCPALKSDPTIYAHLLWSSTCYVPADWYCVDSVRIHPKMGSTVKCLKDGLGQRVSPLMSPFAWAKPKVQARQFNSSQDQHKISFFANLTRNQVVRGVNYVGEDETRIVELSQDDQPEVPHQFRIFPM